MHEMTIKSFSDFDTEVEKLSRSALCRGVPDSSFELMPSLFRGKPTSDLKLLEENLMWVFKSQARANLTALPNTEIEWLVLAQHHGLPTRLLDWSLSPFVALYFATQSLSETDAAIYFYDKKKFKKEEEISLTDLTETVAFFPSHLSKRVTAQQGMFTIHPLDGKPLEDEKIKKLIIPQGKKKNFLDKLFKYGIHHGTMFPDLDGLSRFIRYVNNYPS